MTDPDLELAPDLRQVEAVLLAAREVALPSDFAARARAAEREPAPPPAETFEPEDDEADVAFGRFLVEQATITGGQLREAQRHLRTYRVQRPEVNLAQVLARHGLCGKERLLAAHEAFMASVAPPPVPAAVVGSPVEEARDATPAKGEEERVEEKAGVQVHVLGPSLDRDRARRGARRRSRRLLAGVAAALALGVSSAAAYSVVSSDRQRRKEEFLAAARGALVGGTPSLAEAIAERQALPPGVLEDDEVEAAGKELDAAQVRAAARAASKGLLAGLSAVRDADERLTLCSRAVAADPTHAAALVARARARYALARSKTVAGRVDRAIMAAETLADLEEAIRQAPDEPLAYLVRGQLLLGRRGASASQEAERALRAARDKDVGGALGALAEGLLAVFPDQPDHAVDACTRALALDPTLVDAHLARAWARLRRREFGKALDDANEALRQDPSSVEALALLAESRYFATRSSDRAGALSSLERALKLDPSDPHALAVRAYVRLQRDRLGDTVSGPEERAASKHDAECAIMSSSWEPLAHLALAEVTADTNPVEAKQHASLAIERGRHLVQAWMCRGRLRGKEADEYAIQDFEEVLRLDPTNAQALTNKAAVLFAARRDAEQATVLLDQAIEVDPELPWAYYWRGMIALAPPRNSQKYAQAVADFSEAIARQPNFPDAYFRRACAHHDTGRFLDCLKDLRTAESQRLGSSPAGNFQQHWVDLMRGHCLFFTRQYPEAKAAYEKYRDHAPPGDKAMPAVVRRLDELRQLLAGEITADELSTDRVDAADEPQRRR